MARNRFNFTKVGIEALPVPEAGRRATYHDTKTNGLQIRVTPSGVKTFSVFRWVKGDAKPERITLGRFPDLTIEQARDMAAEINAAIARRENPNVPIRASKGEITLRALFEDFLKNRRNRRGAYLSEKSKTDYQNCFNLYLADAIAGANFADKRLSRIKDTDIAAVHAKIGRKHPTMANRALALLSSLFSYAAEKKLHTKPNPAKGIRKFPETQRERFLQADELPRFFTALAEEPNEMLRDYVLLSLLTGARRSNVLAMKWEQINFARAEWRIPTTKNGTPQTVTLSPEALTILVNRKPTEAAGFVFPSTGKVGHLADPKKGWQRILERAGIADLRIHDLRRTLGSWQAKTGASLAIVGKSLNHKSPSTTAIYARLDLDPVRESVNRATAAMYEAGGRQTKAEVKQLKKKQRA